MSRVLPVTRLPLETLVPALNGYRPSAFFIDHQMSERIIALWHEVARKKGKPHQFLDGYFMASGCHRQFWDIILIGDLSLDETIKLADTRRIKAVVHVDRYQMKGRGVTIDTTPLFSIEDLEKAIAVVLGEGRRRFIIDSPHKPPAVIEVRMLDKEGFF